MFMAPTTPPDPAVDWVTVLISLVVGLLGGVMSALVTGFVQARLARTHARRTAAAALWNFQRTLHDYAIELEATVIRDGTTPVTTTTPADIAEQRALAYPYKGYLGANSKLVERLWYDDWQQGQDPMGPSEDIWKWSKDLGEALTKVLGKHAR